MNTAGRISVSKKIHFSKYNAIIKGYSDMGGWDLNFNKAITTQ